LKVTGKYPEGLDIWTETWMQEPKRIQVKAYPNERMKWRVEMNLAYLFE
jgi:hypothetical protein